MTDELLNKVERAIRLIRSAGADGTTVEVAYSGGKDSDVILALTKMAGIKYRAIYKNTTIDPPGTIRHALDNGAEILRPPKSFFELVAENGFPNQFKRSCCRMLKEYKVLDRAIYGIRKAESTQREKNYEEPTECRVYGRGKKRVGVEAFYPILDWTDEDVVEFITEYGVKIHPLYYREDGTIDPKRRLGCMCCPLAYYEKRLDYFRRYPGMVKAYIRAGQKFRDNHPKAKTISTYPDVYTWFVRDAFFDKQKSWNDHCRVLLTPPYTKNFSKRISA